MKCLWPGGAKHRMQNARVQTTKPLFTRQAMLSNTQLSMITLVRVVLNKLLCPAPLKGGQSWLGFEDKGQSTWGGDKWDAWASVCAWVMCQAHSNPGALTGTSRIFCIVGTAFWLQISVYIYLLYTYISAWSKLRSGSWVPFRMAFMPLQVLEETKQFIQCHSKDFLVVNWCLLN